MTTSSNNKNNWNKRLKTADNAFISDLLHNTGLTGGPSLRDLPWVALTGLGAMGVSSKIKDLKERRQENKPDHQNVSDFSGDMSKMREIIDQHKNSQTPIRNSIHPSVPGFQPDVRSPYGVFDDEAGGYTGGPPPNNATITDISEHPKFNSNDQGKSQKGRPFDREEE
jgi:hypothetical protein